MNDPAAKLATLRTSLRDFDDDRALAASAGYHVNPQT
jgi:hypothetical protein